MSTTAEGLERIPRSAILDDLQRLLDFPEWLGAAADTGRVRTALERHVPELAAAVLTIQACTVRRLRLKQGQSNWTGQYELTIGGPGADQRRTLLLQARVIPPGFAEPASPSSDAAFGTEGWRCYLPELRLELRTQPADPALPALPILTDPAQARALLERSIRACSPAYRDIRIQACAIKALRYKPGSRATVVYRLEYPDEDAARIWPTIVVAKTYSGSKGQNAYDGMRALWNSPLSRGDVVRIAEPLAYIPELKVLVQGPIPEEQTLEDLLKAALRSGAPEALHELEASMCKTAVALAALHTSRVHYGATIAWEDELAEVREVLSRLFIPFPHLAGVAEPLLRRLEALATASPADPAMPSHRAFRPAQVLLHQGQVGFIDFDGFGQAEPALDLSRFVRKARALGMDALKERGEGDAATRLAQMDAICETFLAEYEAYVPVSRQRVALWETLDLLTLVLYCWTKIEPERLHDNMLLLERHLYVSGQVG